jgi:voltage-gated potassium channel
MTASTVPPSAYQRIQSRIFRILEGDVTEPASRFCEIFIALLVILNVVAIILESVPDIHEEWGHYFHYFDLFSVGIFSLEYVLRVWSYAQKLVDEGGTAWVGRKSYIFSFFG